MTLSPKWHRWLRFVLLTTIVWAAARGWTSYQQARQRSQLYEPPPPGMVLIPAGTFRMGSDDPSAEPDEYPQRTVFLPAFYLDRHEVTNRRYREFNKDHKFPPGEEEFPVTFVLKQEAEAFCRWAGRRLPTNAEWEKAARGTDGRQYPWGNSFVTNRANIQRSISTPRERISPQACRVSGKQAVGSFPAGASPFGCEDMAGNVWEWVSDVWRDPAPFWGLFSHPTEPRGILRGGAFNYSPQQARTSYQGFEELHATCHDVGFRCALTAIPRK